MSATVKEPPAQDSAVPTLPDGTIDWSQVDAEHTITFRFTWDVAFIISHPLGADELARHAKAQLEDIGKNWARQLYENLKKEGLLAPETIAAVEKARQNGHS